MAFSNADYQAGLDAVNAATTRLGTDIGKLGDVVAAVAAAFQAMAASLAGAPSASDVATAASQMQAHATVLNTVSDSLDSAEATLTAMAAGPVVPPTPVPAPLPVPVVPTV